MRNADDFHVSLQCFRVPVNLTKYMEALLAFTTHPSQVELRYSYSVKLIGQPLRIVTKSCIPYLIMYLYIIQNSF